MGTIGDPQGPLGGPQSLKTAETCLKSSDIPLSTIHGSNTQFAKVKLSFTKIFYLDFLRHTRLSIGEPPGCLGGPQSLKTAKTSYKSSDIPLSTIHASKAQLKSSHSGIIHLNFSWHTRLSIGNHWGPSGTLRGPQGALQSLKTAKICIKSSDISLITFC